MPPVVMYIATTYQIGSQEPRVGYRFSEPTLARRSATGQMRREPTYGQATIICRTATPTSRPIFNVLDFLSPTAAG